MSYALHIYVKGVFIGLQVLETSWPKLKKKRGGGWRDCPALLRLVKQWQQIKDKIHICALYYEM